MHRGVTGTNRYDTHCTQSLQTAVHVSGLRIEDVVDSSCMYKIFLTFSQPVPVHTRASCSFCSSAVPRRASQMPPNVNIDARCCRTVLTSAHMLDTGRGPKPHHTRCALSHKTAAISTTAAHRQEQSCTSMCREHTRRALCNHTFRYPVPKAQDLDAQQSVPHHLPHSQTRPRTTWPFDSSVLSRRHIKGVLGKICSVTTGNQSNNVSIPPT